MIPEDVNRARFVAQLKSHFPMQFQSDMGSEREGLT